MRVSFGASIKNQTVIPVNGLSFFNSQFQILAHLFLHVRRFKVHTTKMTYIHI